MKHDVIAPKVGESITEVSVLKWLKQSGEVVKAGELLLEIESDKATVEVAAEVSGALIILKPPGERIPVGSVIGIIDDAATGTQAKAASGAAPGPATEVRAQKAVSESLSPSVKKLIEEKGLAGAQIPGTGKNGRITKGDVLGYAAPGPQGAASVPATATRPAAAPTAPQPKISDHPGDRRVPMSMLRQKIAERLVQAQHTAAILTTFNEVDMSAVLALRAEHKEKFKAKHGVSLGFMSFFTRASIEALKAVPEVNATLQGTDIVYHDYFDIGIAVGTERGLVVPVIRDAGKMGFVEIEKIVTEYGTKAKAGKLSIAELTGGTFTISNGGVYGSLLSTPILNPPQSGILGMHKIQERPIAVNGQVVIRPMMYVALSYDHRLIDGKGAVTFLVTLKDFIENPSKLGLEY